MEINTNIYCACCDRFSKPRVFFDDLGNVQQSARCVPQSARHAHTYARNPHTEREYNKQ